MEPEIKTLIESRFSELSSILLNEKNEDGFWTGRLSSSALGVAVAIAAFHFYDQQKYVREIERGLEWLIRNVNSDGSFGDSPESPGNISTSLLVLAATNLYIANDRVKTLNQQITEYLGNQNINVRSPQVAKAILDHYQKDYTFSVPILTMCGLCGIPGPEAFRYIPQLPFELALVPRKFYHMMNLSVVSYAVPALIAVGIVVFKKKKSTAFSRLLRKRAISQSLKLLEKRMPESGGFLEAIPLTAFVALSLVEAGYRNLPVVEKGIGFLARTQRGDGSWPIDVDLSTWVTTLAVKSLRGKLDNTLHQEDKDKLTMHLKSIQNKSVHPFNGTGPGGFGWTNYTGSVPDGDDTSGAILALLKLSRPPEVKKEVLSAVKWLMKLQNNDGGIPTFSRGWGKLPFDESCSDLTGHVVAAFSTSLEIFGEELDAQKKKEIKASFTKLVGYLKNHQKKNGSWLPLWFGNQFTPDHSNPVYGTARVLTYLRDTLKHHWLPTHLRLDIDAMVKAGEFFLLKVKNDDGSWGGNENIRGTIEETGLAVAALSGPQHYNACQAGMEWLDKFYQINGLRAAPVGLYFASLWYDEQLYPLTAYLEACSRMLEES